jgi:hypothetical protein
MDQKPTLALCKGKIFLSPARNQTSVPQLNVIDAYNVSISYDQKDCNAGV